MFLCDCFSLCCVSIEVKMDRESFDKELAKYKIVRLEDYYRSRPKRSELKVSHPAKFANEVTKTKSPVAQNQEEEQSLSFWELMEKHAKEVFTPEETRKFMIALRKNYDQDISDYLNLEDLNTAAAAL